MAGMVAALGAVPVDIGATVIDRGDGRHLGRRRCERSRSHFETQECGKSQQQ